MMVNGEEKAVAEERRRVVKKCSREAEKMDGWRSVVRSWSRIEPWRGAPAHSGASGLLPGAAGANCNCTSAGVNWQRPAAWSSAAASQLSKPNLLVLFS